MPYKIRFKFDCEDESPNQFITDAGGMSIVEIFEEPTCTAPQWSWDADDWKPSPLATHILALLNAHPLPTTPQT